MKKFTKEYLNEKIKENKDNPRSLAHFKVLLDNREKKEAKEKLRIKRLEEKKAKAEATK